MTEEWLKGKLLSSKWTFSLSQTHHLLADILHICAICFVKNIKNRNSISKAFHSFCTPPLSSITEQKNKKQQQQLPFYAFPTRKFNARWTSPLAAFNASRAWVSVNPISIICLTCALISWLNLVGWLVGVGVVGLLVVVVVVGDNDLAKVWRMFLTSLSFFFVSR